MLKVWLPFSKDSFCKLQRLKPCINNDYARLASSVEGISGATIDNISEEEVVAMFICISSGHGFSCELVQ
jgi:hypothetical protein